jgi:hypothetical protein
MPDLDFHWGAEGGGGVNLGFFKNSESSQCDWEAGYRTLNLKYNFLVYSFFKIVKF